MAGKARSTDRTEQRGDETANGTNPEHGETQAQTQVRTGGEGKLTEDVRPSRPAEGSAAGRRSATLNLPFMTAQFRAPDMHVPTRDELAGAARGARSLLPSTGSALFYGGLAVVVVAGAIEWPVAAAIGVGTALASRGAADPQPRGGAPGAVEAEARDARPAESDTPI
jgi:hypothetical protein